MDGTKENTIETFDKNVFLDFITEVKKSFANQFPIEAVTSREEDSSIYSMPDGVQLLFSVSN